MGFFNKNKKTDNDTINVDSKNNLDISPVNKYYDKVVCINLLSRKDKKEHMLHQFKKFNINAEFFTAVPYGFERNIAELITINKKGYFNYKLCNHEVGCALSHYTVIKTAYLEGIDKLFVFEDDCIFNKDFNENFEIYYKHLPTTTNLCMLYSYMDSFNPKNENINNYWKRMYRSWSALAYGMDRQAMKYYLDHMDNYFCIADMPTYKMPDSLECYMAYPPLVIPNYNFGSDIRKIDFSKHKETVLLNNVNLTNYE